MGKLWRGLLWIAAFLVLAGLVVRVVFVDVWALPDDPKTSASVAPSMAGGDTVLFMKRNKPAFGDLVRCTDPDDPAKHVVGRVVGRVPVPAFCRRSLAPGGTMSAPMSRQASAMATMAFTRWPW